MNIVLFGFAMLICTSLNAQWRFSLTYYQDTTSFSGRQAHGYDATDVFYGWDEFVRFNLSYQFSEKHALDGWVDLQSSFEPTNFKLGYQRWFNDKLYAELVGMKQGLFTKLYDDDFEESGYDQYLNMYQYGVGVGGRKSVGIIELSTSIHFLKGISERSQWNELVGSDSNLRTLITQEYQMKGLYSINVEAGAAFRLFDRGNFSGGLMYKFVWRGDRFNYSNEVRLFEWTRNNEVSADIYRTFHAFDHIQHQVGLIIRKK